MFFVVASRLVAWKGLSSRSIPYASSLVISLLKEMLAYLTRLDLADDLNLALLERPELFLRRRYPLGVSGFVSR